MHHLACRQWCHHVIISSKLQTEWKTFGHSRKYPNRRVKDIIFWKAHWNFYICHFTLRNSRENQLSPPGNSAKLCDTPWKFQGPKPKPGHSCTPLEIPPFFWLTPGISTCSFFNTPANSTSSSPAPVWIFPGIAHFEEFRPKTYSFTENCECQLKSGRGHIQKTINKMPTIYQNLDILVTWKHFIKCSGWGFFLSLIIDLKQIYWECGVGEEEGGSSLVTRYLSWHHNTAAV